MAKRQAEGQAGPAKTKKGKLALTSADQNANGDVWLPGNDDDVNPVLPPRFDATKEGQKLIGTALAQVITRNKGLQGVKIAWTHGNMRDGTPHAAGYLGFASTMQMRAFVRRAVLRGNTPAQRLLAAKESKFGETSAKKAAEVKAEKIWSLMTSGGLTDEEFSLLLPIPAGHRLQAMAPLASWLISMFQVLKAHSQCFED